MLMTPHGTIHWATKPEEKALRTSDHVQVPSDAASFRTSLTKHRQASRVYRDQGPHLGVVLALSGRSGWIGSSWCWYRPPHRSPKERPVTQRTFRIAPRGLGLILSWSIVAVSWSQPAFDVDGLLSLSRQVGKKKSQGRREHHRNGARSGGALS